MSSGTKIEWTDASLSPWMGCTPMSAGCAHCYIPATTPGRVRGVKLGHGQPRHLVLTFRKQALALNRKAERWGVRYRVFPSLCDVFDKEVPASWLADFLAVVRATPALDWQILTKRPMFFRERLAAASQAGAFDPEAIQWIADWLNGTPPSNVWVGTSIESAVVMHRFAALKEIPAVLRFLSCEPLLGNIVLPLRADRNVHWVIVGGESGLQARPCAVQWIESLIRQCATAGVPCFVKQLGARPYSAPEHAGATGYDLPISHPKGGDPAEWPEHLRVRQFPVHTPAFGGGAAYQSGQVGGYTRCGDPADGNTFRGDVEGRES